MKPSIALSYFPGDPPVFETVATVTLLLIGALAIFGALAFLGTISNVSWRFRRPMLRIALGLTCLLVIPLVISIVGISRRHFGEWAQLKALIRHYSEIVGHEVERNGNPSRLRAIEAQLLTPPPTFQFAALQEPVRLRIMQTTPPYVGVDFGGGANAVFDPLTMICVYAD